MSTIPTAELAADPRIRHGFAAQLELRAARIAGGERPLGWKLGFGAPAAQAKLGTAAPLIGFLTDRSLTAVDSEYSLAGFANPILEPEVAVRVGRRVDPGGGAEEARDAIAAYAPAFELADLDPPPAEPSTILSGNIFHRAVALGREVEGPPPPEARATVEVAGREPQEVDDVEEQTGRIAELVRHVADLLGAFGHVLDADEVVICGSIVAGISVAPGDSVRYRLEPAGEISLTLSE